MTAHDKRASGARTVKPRKRVSNADRPIVAVIDERACDENGTAYTADELVTALRKLPPQIVVCGNESAQFLRRVVDRYGSNPNFNHRVSPIEREIFTGKNTGRRLVMSLTSVAYFGWEKERCGRNNTARNRYHLLIDPLTFSNKWLEDRSLPAYLRWAQEIRGFCIEQGWNLRPTQGSVARQALQDDRFYPAPRRKVPRATNDRVRDHLPGNHYQLGPVVELDKEYHAEYLDQSRCHHFHARTARLPSADHLNGFGYFRNPDCGKTYKSDPARVAQFLDGFMGLCYGKIYWPISKRKQTPFLPACLVDYGTDKHLANRPVYFFTEDLPLFEALGVTVRTIVAAWGSKKQDTGLANYAKWALNELGNDAPAWKKTLLLAPYGALATTPRTQTVAFHRSKNGTRKTLTTKFGTKLDVSYHQTRRVTEPSTNNVLHRALIESSNRTETLLLAQYLESIGYRVLCIYVDAVIVESDDDLSLPVLHPWRIDKHLSHLRFLSETQFTSSELTKLPGITGAEYRQRVARGTVKGQRGGRQPALGTAEDMRLRAYQAWLAKRDESAPRAGTLDDASSEHRWEILQDALTRG